jgi:hypothetical protein
MSLVVVHAFAVAQQDTTSIVDSLLVKELEQELNALSTAQQPQVVPRSAPSTNPDISAIGDFRSSYTTMGHRRVETYFNELELQVASIVDPYARAEFLFSFGKDLETGELGIELEVGTLTSLSLPYQLQATVGKFKPLFTKVNVLHPHYFSFVDFPLVVNNYFESEGMFMEGASLSWLVPNPFDYFQELVFELGRVGAEPNASLVQGDDNQLLYIGHLKNFFDLTDESTLELGVSGLSGPNQFGFSTLMGALDVTYKWKPLRLGTYRSLTWQTEGLLSRIRVLDTDVIQTCGFYSYIEYQFEKRWFIGGRYDYSGFPAVEAALDRGGALLLRFQPTEFQILALQVSYTNRTYDRDFAQVMLRAIFGIGKHGAHPY